MIFDQPLTLYEYLDIMTRDVDKFFLKGEKPECEFYDYRDVYDQRDALTDKITQTLKNNGIIEEMESFNMCISQTYPSKKSAFKHYDNVMDAIYRKLGKYGKILFGLNKRVGRFYISGDFLSDIFLSHKSDNKSIIIDLYIEGDLGFDNVDYLLRKIQASYGDYYIFNDHSNIIKIIIPGMKRILCIHQHIPEPIFSLINNLDYGHKQILCVFDYDCYEPSIYMSKRFIFTKISGYEFSHTGTSFDPYSVVCGLKKGLNFMITSFFFDMFFKNEYNVKEILQHFDEPSPDININDMVITAQDDIESNIVKYSVLHNATVLHTSMFSQFSSPGILANLLSSEYYDKVIPNCSDTLIVKDDILDGVLHFRMIAKIANYLYKNDKQLTPVVIKNRLDFLDILSQIDKSNLISINVDDVNFLFIINRTRLIINDDNFILVPVKYLNMLKYKWTFTFDQMLPVGFTIHNLLSDDVLDTVFTDMSNNMSHYHNNIIYIAQMITLYIYINGNSNGIDGYMSRSAEINKILRKYKKHAANMTPENVQLLDSVNVLHNMFDVCTLIEFSDVDLITQAKPFLEKANGIVVDNYDIKCTVFELNDGCILTLLSLPEQHTISEDNQRDRQLAYTNLLEKVPTIITADSGYSIQIKHDQPSIYTGVSIHIKPIHISIHDDGVNNSYKYKLSNTHALHQTNIHKTYVKINRHLVITDTHVIVYIAAIPGLIQNLKYFMTRVASSYTGPILTITKNTARIGVVSFDRELFDISSKESGVTHLSISKRCLKLIPITRYILKPFVGKYYDPDDETMRVMPVTVFI